MQTRWDVNLKLVQRAWVCDDASKRSAAPGVVVDLDVKKRDLVADVIAAVDAIVLKKHGHLPVDAAVKLQSSPELRED
ncbi:hypothetical protein WOLCODRAFT_157916 [Wolfiporia cocos MD-104 SS10]|uniref:Uncharacterized protein n=1 Tax=Wolfiporia cocos (strain MD-104) TaxID=742152 RepID=A0A2H3JHL4_WOLCO|nr:hypothetical protein WOLCODRAFT_157916 [Wolfiporia cocos MD-104 SS10]